MYVTVHAAAGAAIATFFPNPLVSMPVAFGSHFLLDAIPHWHDATKEEKITRRTFVYSSGDIVLASILTLYLLFTSSLPFLGLVIICSTIMDTDVLLFPYFEKRGWRKIWPKSFSRFHRNIQSETKSYWGLVTQLIIFLLSFLIIFNYG